MITPYLAAEAATRADHELSARPHHPRLTGPVLAEIDYTVNLLRRADKAISAEVAVLRPYDVSIDWAAVTAACNVLIGTAVLLTIRAKREREHAEYVAMGMETCA